MAVPKLVDFQWPVVVQEQHLDVPQKKTLFVLEMSPFLRFILEFVESSLSSPFQLPEANCSFT
jgi:hypothetical protein